jgi:hypothetical protein
MLAIECVPGRRLHALDALALHLGGEFKYLGKTFRIEVKNG